MRLHNDGHAISEECFDADHATCYWPTSPRFKIHCSCDCHDDARAHCTEERPRMSQKTSYDLADLRRRAAQRKGGDTLSITVGGRSYSMPMPGFWPDHLKEALRRVADTGDVVFAQTLLGKEEYAKFVEAGGRADDLMLLIQEHREDQGADLGESSPSPN
ncbi:hypothetical protein [Streptomyces lonarensis]|uniref:Uncharacterized protein n=1 Tax=Streptomyces lonarensis TaxID=700599 RepID=A0A7X6CXE9_9ACTN|nr:hypothetical protein [Streptomyces lonarensis]NJQ04293.1 hypothetical protein [Streptomyces lonarensis]